MKIEPNISLADIQSKGTAEQRAAAAFFDNDNNGILDADEISAFTSSKIIVSENELSITLANGETTTLDNFAKAKSDDYYEAGTIPVAVVDIFSGGECGGAAWHGRGVANIIKMQNPDISISQFDVTPLKAWTSPTQKTILGLFQKFPSLEKLAMGNDTLRSFIEQQKPSLEDTNKVYENTFKKIKAQIDAGKGFRAINLSSAMPVTYEQINELCSKEIGVELTPENIAQYRAQIKNILIKKTEKGENIQFCDKLRDSGSISAKQLLATLKAIEDTKIPVYMSQEYKLDDYKKQSFNFYSLADNAKTVEGGTVSVDGTPISPVGSTNSFAVDEKTGKRRIASIPVYWGDEITKNSTSFAAPVILARELKEQN